MVENWTLAQLLDSAGDEQTKRAVHALYERAVVRKDGVAVYENEDLNHSELGHMQFVTYGSDACQIAGRRAPRTLPDIGNRINWRYQLKAVAGGAGVDEDRILAPDLDA